MVKSDIEKVADLTHLRVIALVGGRRKMIERTRQAREELKSYGLIYVSAKAETPDSLHRAGTGLYCVVPLTYRVKTRTHGCC
jgi:hypothetical protein